MFSSDKWFGSTPSFYNGVATQSLRFDSGSSSYLTRTYGSGNQALWTASMWIKRSSLTNDYFFGSQASGSDIGSFSFNSSNQLVVNNKVGSSTGVVLNTDMVFRDISAWYHLVVVYKGDESSASNRAKIYVNGSQVSTTVTESLSTGNGYFNSANTHGVGRVGTYTSNFFNGYMAEVNLVDGYGYDPTYFGESKNGVWIPKKYTGSYGTNGFRLEFKQTGTGTASSSTIGADTSGNNNHYTSSGIAAHDCNIPDSPENNFATMNPLINGYGTNLTMSEGSLKASSSADEYNNTFGTILMQSGKWYWEITSDNFNNYAMYGVAIENAVQTTDSTSYGQTGVYVYATHGEVYNETASSSGSYTSFQNQEIIGIAVDLDASPRTFKFYNNNTLQGTTNLSTNFNVDLLPIFVLGGAQNAFVNFGQDSSFAGQKTAQGNTDGNGIGDFYYAPPSGHLALCSANLPEPTISPNADTQADDHFNTVLYTGNATDNRSITGFGLTPDWLWIKNRSNSASHHITDTSRGGALRLRSNSTGAEENQTDRFTSIDTDGFTITGSDSDTNANSNTYVAWGWKANGTTPTKTYKVVVVSDSGNKYRFRNSADSATFAQSAVTLDLQEGGTYTFDWSDSTAQGHPIRFSTTSDGTHGGGSEYTTGVVKDDSAYKTTITVASGVATLYYYCQYHSGMGGQINTNSTFGSTNFDGSILSVSNPNTTSGFSINLYTGSGTNNTDLGIAHGLGVTPKMVWVKNRSTAKSWQVYNSNLSADGTYGIKNIFLDTTGAEDAYSDYIKTTSSTTFTIRSDASDGVGRVNKNGDNYVAYCFAEVEGYSKIGSYTGNGDADGAFVFTGFRPAWVMTKETSATSSWNIYDNVRSDDNPATELLIANSSNSEGTGTDIDIVSNGFKVRSTSGNINTSGNNYIYMAFAEAPFKFANAR